MSTSARCAILWMFSMCVQSCRCKCVREEGRGTARSCKGNCRKPQMSSWARGNLKLKLKPRLKLQLQLQLTPELRFDLKLWQRCLLLHPVTVSTPCDCCRKNPSWFLLLLGCSFKMDVHFSSTASDGAAEKRQVAQSICSLANRRQNWQRQRERGERG